MALIKSVLSGPSPNSQPSVSFIETDAALRTGGANTVPNSFLSTLGESSSSRVYPPLASSLCYGASSHYPMESSGNNNRIRSGSPPAPLVEFPTVDNNPSEGSLNSGSMNKDTNPHFSHQSLGRIAPFGSSLFLTDHRNSRSFNVPSAKAATAAAAQQENLARGASRAEMEPVNGSVEDFEYMVGDMRRIFGSWIRAAETKLSNSRDALLVEIKRFEAERDTKLKELDELKIQEYERIKEERLKVEQEAASIMKQIEIERNESRRRIKEEKKKLDFEKTQHKRAMLMEQERLRREAEAVDAERRRVVDTNIATESMVEINVGGTVFQTSRHTLTQFPGSFLEALLSGRHSVNRDRNGRIFIDRDSELFRSILNYLRNPETPPPAKDCVESDSLCREASFYGVKFFPFPLVLAVGGNDGAEYLRSVEVLDISQQCWRHCHQLETARAHFSGGTLLNRIYVCGGQNIDYRALCDVEVYDALRDEWMSACPLLVPRRNTAGAVLGERVFCIGGFDGSEILDSVEAYDPRMRNWMLIAPLSCPRSSAMTAVCGGKIYVLGGSKGERLRSIERYEPRMNVWEPLQHDMIEVRSSACGGSVLDFVFAIGGVDGGQNIHDTIEMANPELGDWHFRKPMPCQKQDMGCVVVEHSVVLAGGQCHSQVLSSVDFYRPELDVWQSGPSLIVPRFGHQLLSAAL